MEKRWIYKPIPSEDDIHQLSSAINVNPALASLLLQRNICDFDAAKAFFRPDLNNLHDPFLMKDMDKAVERLQKAIRDKEKILVYGDYDVDGTTSVAMTFDFLSELTTEIDYYIPDRYKEGYGVSSQSITWAYENNFSLIISLDCGIKSNTLIARAKEAGIDFIVCDHHQPSDDLPPAYAVLDPKRPDCPYPYKELSGCGVGFKLLQGLCIREGYDQNLVFDYLDLLAISITSDIVPITGENRILTFYGIKKINDCPRPGVRALSDVSGYDKELDVTNIVFGIGPRINAAGRIAHAKAAVELLLSKTQEEADKLAFGVNKNNTLRKDFDASITEEAIKMIESDERLLQAKSTVLYKDTWHKGVIGIVASRCIEKYHRPTIILTKSNEVAAGSARSVVGFDVYEAIERCSDLLVQFGGHKYAAGLTIQIDKIDAFQKKFEEEVSKYIRPEQLIPHQEIDHKIDLSSINYKFYNIIRQMRPFGPGNMQPVFVSERVKDNGQGRLLKEQHLKLFLKQNGDEAVEAIGFGMVHFYERIKKGEEFDICYNICENNFNGRKSLQLMIKDIKFLK